MPQLCLEFGHVSNPKSFPGRWGEREREGETEIGTDRCDVTGHAQDTPGVHHEVTTRHVVTQERTEIGSTTTILLHLHSFSKKNKCKQLQFVITICKQNIIETIYFLFPFKSIKRTESHGG